MNNKLFKVALGVVALGCGSLFADSVSSFYPYVEVKGGLMKPGKRDNVEYKTGGNGSVEFGVSYDAWRLGLELAYRSASIKKVNGADFAAGTSVKYTSLAGMVNAYYDYALTEECFLYAGLGCGLAQAGYKYKTAAADYTVSKLVFAWQLMAGVGYDINENFTVSAGYRLFNTSKVKATGFAQANLVDKKAPYCHSVELGLRYSF